MASSQGEHIDTVLLHDIGIYQEWIAFAQTKLRHCAAKKLRRLYTGEDIVHELFVKLSTGERRWDQEKYPDLHNYFFSVDQKPYRQPCRQRAALRQYLGRFSAPVFGKRPRA
ncbi:MAG TPA: hypothetical protein VMU30_11220 [Bacteroidota bacterium]|nr:hypothetical protein [Bacteroidota bacterium]